MKQCAKLLFGRLRGGPSYPSPIVIVSAPESRQHINLSLIPLPGVATTVMDTPHKHYVQVSQVYRRAPSGILQAYSLRQNFKF